MAKHDGTAYLRATVRGLTIGINGAHMLTDFVYLSVPWATGIGEPYIIARVMDFVAADGRTPTQLRANVFLRMRDLTHRANNDPRLLVATMHADIYDLESVRGKCRVLHRELISNGSTPEVAAWKRRDDHFYYHQLYDRYIHRFYDVVPTYRVKNAPDEVLATLRDRYSFIVAEVGISADLCDALRGCAVCRQWAASVESVRCDTCRKFFHMNCLSPPLLSKPAKGYSWSCAQCAKEHDDIVEEQGVGGGGLDSNQTNGHRGPRTGAARRAPKASMIGDVPDPESELLSRSEEDRVGLRCFHGWPYRYFGEHTKALDTLDPHDIIYPRAVTRVGAKYQVAVSQFGDQLEPERFESTRKTKGKPKKSVDDEPIYERGTDGSVDVEYIHAVPDRQGVYLLTVDEFLGAATMPRSSAPHYSLSFLDRALRTYYENTYDPQQTYQVLVQLRDADLGIVHFSEKESRDFAAAMVDHDSEMRQLKKALPQRTPAEIVRYMYAWKTQQLGKQWAAMREGKKLDQRQNQLGTRASSPSESVLDDGEENAGHACAFCGTHESPMWYRGLWSWTNRALCVFCGQYWRKYAAETSSVAITPAKRKYALDSGSDEVGLGVLLPDATAAQASRRVASSPPEHGRCVLCRRGDSKKRLKSCANCALVVHQGCAALSDTDMERDTWRCDVCFNEADPTAALLPRCVLCGKKPPSDPHALSALDVYKATECDGWAHLVCATWMPDIVFGNPEVLHPVEGVGALSTWRYNTPCLLCGETCGAVVACAEPTCHTHFHVSCAFQAQPAFTLGFEIFPVKTSRRDSVATVSFKAETGHMLAQVWCKEHRGVARSKTVYDFFETDPKLGMVRCCSQTALQAYTQTHKQVSSSAHRTAVVESSHALLRRAKRLDAVLQVAGGAGAVVRGSSLVPLGAEPRATIKEDDEHKDSACMRCHTTWTPYWWSVAGGVCCNMCRPQLAPEAAAQA